jgi:Tfp pilus assembly protein PilN
MINLLPPETRNDLLYARKNNQLRRWLVYLLIGLLGALLIFGGGVFYLSQTTKNLNENSRKARESLQLQKIEETQAQVEQLSSNVKLTTQVLSREILFSKLLTQLGSALPANTALSQLQIDKLQGGLTITALAKDIESATQIQLNLQDPKNQIFEKADIENISCSDSALSAYDCTVQLRALFAKNNPFLFISSTDKVTKQ